MTRVEQLLSADLFGLKALGKILGGVNVVDTLGGAMGPVLTSSLYVSTQSFELPFMVITGLLFIATAAAAMLRMSDAAYLQAEQQQA